MNKSYVFRAIVFCWHRFLYTNAGGFTKNLYFLSSLHLSSVEENNLKKRIVQYFWYSFYGM